MTLPPLHADLQIKIFGCLYNYFNLKKRLALAVSRLSQYILILEILAKVRCNPSSVIKFRIVAQAIKRIRLEKLWVTVIQLILLLKRKKSEFKI
eukprot:UN27705